MLATSISGFAFSQIGGFALQALSKLKEARTFIKKTRGAPRDVLVIRDLLRVVERPLQICADLGVRHEVCDVVAPVLDMAIAVMAEYEELGVEGGPADWTGWLVLKLDVIARMIVKLERLVSTLGLVIATVGQLLGPKVTQAWHIPWQMVPAAHEAAKAHFDDIAKGRELCKRIPVAVATVYKGAQTNGTAVEIIGCGDTADDTDVDFPAFDVHLCTAQTAEAERGSGSGGVDGSLYRFRLELTVRGPCGGSIDGNVEGDDVCSGPSSVDRNGGGGDGDASPRQDAGPVVVELSAGTQLTRCWRGEVRLAGLECTTEREKGECVFEILTATQKRWMFVPRCAQMAATGGDNEAYDDHDEPVQVGALLLL
jgi:hypothetical protein